MPGARPRRALIALALVSALGAATFGVHRFVVGAVEDRLAARGVSAERRHDRLDGASWHDLVGPGIKVERLDLALIPAFGVALSGVVVDPSEVAPGTATAAESVEAGPELVVSARDLAVHWGDVVVIDGLSGQLRPKVDLSGEGGHLVEEDGRVELRVRRTLRLGPVSGAATVDATYSQGKVSARMRVPEAVIDHPMLAARPLDPLPLTLDGTWDRASGELLADLDLNGVHVVISGELRAEPLRYALQARMDLTELADIIRLFGELIPEARGARVVGEVGFEATLEGPELAWTLTPLAEGLGADSVIPDPGTLLHGPITWRAGTPGGHWIVRTTGEGTADWVPLEGVGRMADAVVAAEDGKFWTHEGYDLEAIRAALADAAREGTADMRGGSTITQQLAKNLFLDGERTLARKLRELLYALELERVIQKERIMALYLNVVELGPEIHGISDGARAYYLKRPTHLSLREAAFLACILPAPRAFYERAYVGGRVPNGRVGRVLQNMRDAGRITDSQLYAAQQEILRFVPPPR